MLNDPVAQRTDAKAAERLKIDDEVLAAFSPSSPTNMQAPYMGNNPFDNWRDSHRGKA